MNWSLLQFLVSFDFYLTYVCFVVQEQLHEREQMIHQLERKMEEKDRELHAIKLDNEAVCFNLLCL